MTTEKGKKEESSMKNKEKKNWKWIAIKKLKKLYSKII